MTDTQPTATPLPEGIVARAARALGYVVTGSAGGWFGPFATKLEDFAIPQLDFDVFANPAGNLLAWSFAEVP
jgi:hypothetical protein